MLQLSRACETAPYACPVMSCPLGTQVSEFVSRFHVLPSTHFGHVGLSLSLCVCVCVCVCVFVPACVLADHFSTFSVSLFTMFQVMGLAQIVQATVSLLLSHISLLTCRYSQVVTGDSWASSVTRGLFQGNA